MACLEEALSQLLLLLWKSWKTLIRSPGWAATQVMFTLMAWAGVVGLMLMLKPDKLGLGPAFNASQMDVRDDLRPLEYRCATGRTCSDEINSALAELCYNSNPSLAGNESNASLCTPTTKSGNLIIRALNATSVDIVYHSEDKKACDASKHTSSQFDNVPGITMCQAQPIFRRLAQHAGKFGRLAIRYLTPLDFRADLPETAAGLLMSAYTNPIMFFCLQATITISQESTSQIKDYLLSMGMSRTLYFFHHFLFNYLKTLIVVIGSSAIIGGMFKTVGLSFHLLTLFSLAAASWTSLSLLVGAAFRKPMNSVIVMLFLYLEMESAPALWTVKRTSLLSLLYCLAPQYAVHLALDAKREVDFRSKNLWFAEVEEALPQGYYLIMLLLDTILYFLLAIFVDWARTSLENPLSLLRRKMAKVAPDDSNKSLRRNHEQTESRSAADLVVEGVHKVYSSGEHAVRGVDMNMYKGQVTALLGHNGAGKSTIFGMISGMIVPTEGRIQCLDAEDREARQKLIGYCPQYNAVFPKLTVNEHLEFFACLKGADASSETGESVLLALGMAGCGEAKAHQLSGGMMRKLCIAIALAGDSPIILLDEPTAGLDPGARRDFERMLVEWKKDHVILLTTHYTDEAEMLADRIFIMARGRVFCSGTPAFLRKKFDSGYILSFAVENETDLDGACDEMMKTVKEFAGDQVTLKKKRGKQFEFKLSTDDSSRFVEMFKKLEAFGPYFGVQSYGLAMNKLEHVFLKVGEMTGTVDRSEDVEIALKELIQENDKRVTGAAKSMKQFGIGLLKRLHFDIAHLPSILFVLALIFGGTYMMMRDKGEAASTSGSTDLLHLSDRYRIGVDSSLHAEIGEIRRAVKLFGNDLIIEKASHPIPGWFHDNARNRPPILGGLERGKDGGWTIYVPPRNELLLPTLEAIAAMVNNPALKQVKFALKQIDTKVNEDVEKMMRDISFPLKLFGSLLLIGPLMVAWPISFYVVERTSNFRHQERLTGVSRFILLSSSILYDFFLFLLHFLVFLGACFAADAKGTSGALMEVTLLPLLVFLSGELLILTLHRLFSTRARGFLMMMCLMFFAGVIARMLTLFRLTEALGLILSPLVAAKEWRTGGSKLAPYLLAAHFVLLLAAFVIVESRPWETCKRRKNKRASKSLEVSMKQLSDSLTLRVTDLWKWYGPKKARVAAVRGITFGVRSHECFGVLGTNGAGKTSTFEMLTGNSLPDGGSATVAGVDCSTPATIGYCPQADALMDDLTGRQSLVILAALHGYSDPRRVTDIVLTCVGMKEHADKTTKRYSGGQRRKISVAASLLAQNSLIILDEPTAGIDPVARRDIWSVICALRESTNTAVVLTSHSMDEVEALVSSLIIMREGSIVAEGSPQLIKNQFGEHYNFNLVIENATNVGMITSHVRLAFPGATLHDSASLRNIKYRIPRRKTDIFSALFEKAEDVAEELKATDFSFTQATLEDAFMLAASDRQPDIMTAVAAVDTSLMAKVRSESLKSAKSKKSLEENKDGKDGSAKEKTETTEGTGTEGNGSGGPDGPPDFTGTERGWTVSGKTTREV